MYKVEYLNDEGRWVTEYWNLSFPEAMHYANQLRLQGIRTARVVYNKTGWTIRAMQSQ